MPTRLLITGANGYLGSACISRLANVFDREVVAVWHTRSDRLLETPPSHIHYEMCDLSSPAEVERLFNDWNIGTVVHAAALLPDNAPGYSHRAAFANIVATTNLVECAAASVCSRFVYCSSTSIYGDTPLPDNGWHEEQGVTPSSIYGWSKYAGEECLRIRCVDRGLAGVSLRFAGIHGPGREGGVVFHVMRAALSGEQIVLNDERNPFQLLFLGDAVDGILCASHASVKSPYKSINVASHTYPSLTALAEQIITDCDSKSRIRQDSTSSSTPQIMNTSRMTDELAFAPASPDSSLRAMRNWMIAGANVHE